MVQLKHSQRRVIEDVLDMGGGYVLNFSDRAFAEFFEDQAWDVARAVPDFARSSIRATLLLRPCRQRPCRHATNT